MTHYRHWSRAVWLRVLRTAGNKAIKENRRRHIRMIDTMNKLNADREDWQDELPGPSVWIPIDGYIGIDGQEPPSPLADVQYPYIHVTPDDFKEPVGDGDHWPKSHLTPGDISERRRDYEKREEARRMRSIRHAAAERAQRKTEERTRRRHQELVRAAAARQKEFELKTYEGPFPKHSMSIASLIEQKRRFFIGHPAFVHVLVNMLNGRLTCKHCKKNALPHPGVDRSSSLFVHFLIGPSFDSAAWDFADNHDICRQAFISGVSASHAG